MLTTLYALVDPRKPGDVRYVGKTSGSLRVRLNGHLQKARSGQRRRSCAWVRKLLREGVLPVLEPLDVVVGNGAAAEVQMIALCKLLGARITNHTEGGEGSVGFKHTPETRARMSAAKQGKPSPKKGTTLSPAVRAKIASSLRGKTQSQAANDKRSSALRGRSFSEAHRAALSANHRTKKMPSSQRY